MFSTVFVIFALFSVCICGRSDDISLQEKKSVLIIGSSVPALTSALLLTDYNHSVTIFYATSDIDNQISPTTTVVQDSIYRLPKHHPSIFEHSTLTRNLAKRFGNDFSTEEELNLWLNDKEQLSISKDEWIPVLLINTLYHKCITISDIMKSRRFVDSVKKYDYVKYRKLYSNITMAQFAALMKAPASFITCFLNPVLTDLGMQLDNINAADAIARMHFYYLNGENGLRSYHMNNPYTSKDDSKLLIDQIIGQLKLKNTTFIGNYSIKAFWIDPDSGKILGDLNNRKVVFDYVILGDTLNRSRVLLKTTQSYNTGVPQIFEPLKKLLGSLDQYSYSPKLLSIKLWFSEGPKSDRKSVLEIGNYIYPYWFQSIKQLDKLSGQDNHGHILEIIVAEISSTHTINITTIVDELCTIWPELRTSKIYNHRVDPIDLGVTMDVKYGTNRLSTSSLLKYGIPNLILAADWLDVGNDSIACDLEKSFAIGYQAASIINNR